MINNISLRDWFAGQAIAGSAFSDYSAVNVAKRADEIADAMMARRAELPSEKQADDFVMPVVFDSDALRLVADGDIESLEMAFDWGSSSQGDDHWHYISIGEKLLSETDKEYLKQVLARIDQKAEL